MCRKNSTIVNCKYVRIYPLQQRSTEISITCVDGDFCNQTRAYSDLCYYVVMDSGIMYQTCTCCSQQCDEEIYQPDSKDVGAMLANVNSFWIINDISVTKKHRLSGYHAPRNLFILMANHSTLSLKTKKTQEARYLAHLKRDYQNIQAQAKNILFIHYLIKRITATHSVRIRLDDLRSMEFELSIQETIRVVDKKLNG
ncbi:DEAD-box ATP-dependent RNA helicase 52C [Dirofilaria immitis]